MMKVRKALLILIYISIILTSCIPSLPDWLKICLDIVMTILSSIVNYLIFTYYHNLAEVKKTVFTLVMQVVQVITLLVFLYGFIFVDLMVIMFREESLRLIYLYPNLVCSLLSPEPHYLVVHSLVSILLIFKIFIICCPNTYLAMNHKIYFSMAIILTAVLFVITHVLIISFTNTLCSLYVVSEINLRFQLDLDMSIFTSSIVPYVPFHLPFVVVPECICRWPILIDWLKKKRDDRNTMELEKDIVISEQNNKRNNMDLAKDIVISEQNNKRNTIKLEEDIEISAQNNKCNGEKRQQCDTSIIIHAMVSKELLVSDSFKKTALIHKDKECGTQSVTSFYLPLDRTIREQKSLKIKEIAQVSHIQLEAQSTDSPSISETQTGKTGSNYKKESQVDEENMIQEEIKLADTFESNIQSSYKSDKITNREISKRKYPWIYLVDTTLIIMIVISMVIVMIVMCTTDNSSNTYVWMFYSGNSRGREVLTHLRKPGV